MDPTTLQSAKKYAASISGDQGRGVTVVGIGDSITQADGDQSANITANSWLTYMALASAGRMRLVRNSGIGGQRSNPMLARFQTDVLAYSPAVVLIASGTNDTEWSETLSAVEQMIRLALRSGAAVGLLTAPPGGSPVTSSPTGLTAATNTASGTLAAGSYDYCVLTASQGGRSLRTNTVTATLGATGQVRLDWSRAHGEAYRYLIYRRASGAGNYGFIGGIGAGYGRADVYPYFIDTGLTANASDNPPTIDQQATGNYSGALISAGRRTQLIRVGQVMNQLAAKYGLPIVDQYAGLVDTTTGLYPAGASVDGTHPGSRVQRTMGQNAWAGLKSLFPAYTAQLTMDPYDLDGILGSAYNSASDLISRALLPTNASLPSTASPTSWAYFGSAGANVTLATDAAVVGNAYTVTTTDYAQKFTTIDLPTNRWAVGDRLRVAFKLKTAGLDANAGGVRYFLNYNGGSMFALNLTVDWDWTVWTAEGIVPPGTTGITFGFSVLGRNVAASIAQVTINNLTAEGTA